MTNTFGFARKSLTLGVSSAALLAALAVPAAAQTTAGPAASSSQSGDAATPASQDIQDQRQSNDPAGASHQDQGNGDVVVTGTLFRRTNTETTSPVTVLTTQTLARANITTINDAVRSVSADSAGSISTGFKNGFSAGGAAVSLRGLGVSSTVILIDGLRSTNYPLNDDGHNAYVDLNSIPFSLIDRVEVLKDGASSTYGADAIGGVVNIITKRHFAGVEGSAQGGTTQRGDGSHYRATLTAGFGNYEEQGFNVYLNGEYTQDGTITNASRGFPYNTLDLSSIGGADKNRNDDSLLVSNPQAVVTRVGQTDPNNPLAGQAGTPPTTSYQLLNPGSCPFGTYTVTTGAAQGTGCRHNLVDEYTIIQPYQQRYSGSGRASLRLGEHLEAYLTGSYTHDYVRITGAPAGIRQTQPFGASPTLASSNPGIVLPVYVCAAGVNCATAADRRFNPNNPFAALGSAARIYYAFGDIPQGSDRYNDVYRTTAGIQGQIGDGYDVALEGVYARDNFKLTQHGLPNIAGLLQAINTGAYNFVNPETNSAAVRAQVAPDVTTPSYSTLASLDGHIGKSLFALPGGDLKLAIGGQVRRETLNNRNQNATLNTYALNTSSAAGRHTIAAGYFELDAPIFDQLDVNVSGRYDHYSEGFNHFSPKVGVKFTPIRQLALRGTYSEGFRAPNFAENNASSQYAGFSSFTPPTSFANIHGSAANPYATTYNLGSGAQGNPNLAPETSRSFTAGAIVQPAKWFSFTVDYYNIKKSNLIVSGPLTNQARAAYYSVSGNAYPTAAAAQAAACAAVAAVGPGYSCNVVDAVDPLFPNALPRLLIYNVPFVNANYDITSGIDVQATATVPLGSGVRFISRIEVTDVFKYDRHTSGGVQKFVGTLGPYELSSGNGTPRVRGNWQNTLDTGALSLTATAYYTSHIKAVAADESTDLSCAANLYGTSPDASGNTFCYIHSFIDVDLNAGVKVNDKFRFFFNVQNLFDARAPLAAAAYTSNPNYLASWHYQGLVGRNYSAGINFSF